MFSHTHKKEIREMMYVLINLMGGILSQRICISCISNHCTVHFKYLTMLFVNYTLIKLKEKLNKNSLAECKLSHLQLSLCLSPS